ncbi:probable methyltransferase-like protein 24 isoform X2 [Camelus dromedarius]|uniref:probable methyltransferase-like protein 24 isoform X2 n=1 Tax=Camelus dromedarius TaxID=9838 RepID=UPI00311A2283
MAWERPPGRGCSALRRCLLGAAVLLGLRLCVELRRTGPRLPARSARPDPAPRPPGPHLLPAPGPLRGASRRQVTYVRSGRRAPPGGGGSGTPEPGCCAQRGRLRRKGPRWHIDLQPWAGPARSLDEEALRFLRYISTTQIACDHMSTDSLATDSSPAKKPWSVCLDDRFGLAHQIRNKQCRLYSLGLGSDDTHFEVGMANDGCEVHCFDPSVKSAHVLESERLWYHRVSVDWRDPHPAVAAQKPYSSTRKLGTILNEFGHRKFLKRGMMKFLSSFVYRLMFSKQIWKVQNGKFWKILFWKMSLNKLDSSSLRSISTGPALRLPEKILQGLEVTLGPGWSQYVALCSWILEMVQLLRSAV